MTHSKTALILAGMLLVSTSGRADDLRYLPTGKAALAKRIQDIRSAKVSIDLSTFTLRACDTSTKILLNQLKARAANGVKVRIIGDAYEEQNPATRAAFATALAKHGIELKYFNSYTRKPNPLANHRSHAKVLVVDGKTEQGKYITGGRNIGDEYFGLSEKHNFIDRDVAVQGPSVKQAATGFDTLWNSGPAFHPPRVPDAEVAKFEAECLNQPAREKRDKAVEKNILAQAARLEARLKPVRCDNTQFTIDRPDFVGASGGTQARDLKDGTSYNDFLTGERYQRKQTTKAIVDITNAAKSSAMFENWAYVPVGPIRAKIDELRDKGRPVEIYTSQTTDVRSTTYLSRSAQERDRKGSQTIYSMSTTGAANDAWEMTPDTRPAWIIHSKVATFDNAHSVVSSFNLGDRSYHTNVESAVITTNCPDFAVVVNEASRTLRAAHLVDARKGHRDQDPAFSPLEKLGYRATGVLQ